MNPKVEAYLNAPIPRKVALAISIGQGVGCTYAAWRSMKKLESQANAIIADQTERLTIYSEAMEVLLKDATPETLGKLNDQLGFWAIIRGHSAQEPKPDN